MNHSGGLPPRSLPSWRRIFFAAILVLLSLQPARAFVAPDFRGDVLDETGLLDQTQTSTLLRRIETMRAESGIWAAIYIAHGLQGDNIENAAVVTFEKWRLGQAGKDNGLLVLIVPGERRMRIEVGYGLEGSITDVLSKRIIDEIFKPAFRENRFAEGILQGFDIMEQAMHGEQGLLPANPPPPPPAEPEIDWSGFFPRFFATLAANMGLPLSYLLARRYGKAHGRVIDASGPIDPKGMFILFTFLGVFFGLFFAVFGAAFAGDIEPLLTLAGMNALFAGLFGLALLARIRAYLSASAYRRWQARERLLRIRKRSHVKRKIFGVWFDPAEATVSRGGTKPEPRSTSGSGSSFGSSSGSSSSSGGGRSGGGGASGSW